MVASRFGGGNELQALFDSPINRYLFLALAQESAEPTPVAPFGLRATIPCRCRAPAIECAWGHS